MSRLAYRFYRIVSTVLHWARRRLTPGGWIVTFAIILTAGMATDIEQSLGYQAFGLLICLAGASILMAPFFRIRFAAERVLPRLGTAQNPLHYKITIRNGNAKRQSGLWVFDDLTDPRPSYEEFLQETQPTRRRRSFRLSTSAAPPRASAPAPQPLPTLDPSGDATVEMHLVPRKRGVLRFSSVSLARPDPFALFRGFRRVSLPGSITILPKRYALPPLALPGASRYQRGGVSFASSVGESEEFVALRDYRHGDPQRRIHWRSWAKVGRPVVKEFQDEFFVRHALVLDTFTDPDDVDIFETAVSVAASFACTIDTQESLLDLLFVGPQTYCFTVGRGLAHAEQMLEILASVQTCPQKDFEALEQTVIEHSAVVSGCICIFVRWDHRRRELVQKLEMLGVPVMVLVIQPPRGADREQSPESTVAPGATVHDIHVDSVAEDLSKL